MTANKAGSPHGASRRASRVYRNRIEYGKPTTPRLPVNWRDRLPDPVDYYRARIERLSGPNASGYASAPCPFHADRSPSFTVKLSGRGHWECHATSCGLRGDMVAFHERITGMPFAAAVADLLRGGR